MLWPALLRLNSRYPDIKVEVSIEPALTDIVTEQYDAGVRRGEQIARDMIALCIGPDLSRVVVPIDNGWRLSLNNNHHHGGTKSPALN